MKFNTNTVTATGETPKFTANARPETVRSQPTSI